MFPTEKDFVHWLTRQARGSSRGLRLGIGDDAAVVKPTPGHELILTSDLSIEGVHFTQGLHPPQSVGHRALARSLSDVAAMGGKPRFALVSLVISKGSGEQWIRGFYGGLLRLAERFGVTLVGGDTALAPAADADRTVIDVIAIGEVENGRALCRSGARPGDQIFVSGRLGLSALGLDALQRANSPRRRSQAVRAHLYPEPRCLLGRYLASKGLASACIDLSDGLSTDLHRLCAASGVGALIRADHLPVVVSSNVIRGMSTVPGGDDGGLDALRWALDGGEDYELAFTVRPARIARIPSHYDGVPLSRIGEIREEVKLLLVRPDGKQVSLEPRGYDHFRK